MAATNGSAPNGSGAPIPDLLTDASSFGSRHAVGRSLSKSGSAKEREQQEQGVEGGGTANDMVPDVARSGGPGGFRNTMMAAVTKAPQKALAFTGAAPGPSRKHLTYGHLARQLKELSAAPEYRKGITQMVSSTFPKLCVYNSVDPSIAPALVHLLQAAGDPHLLRYAYFFLSRILTESGDPMYAPGGGVPTPNWDMVVDTVTGETSSSARAEVLPQILSRLVTEASTPNIEVHARRVAALKSLLSIPLNHQDAYTAIVKIIFLILDKLSEDKKQRRRKTSIFGRGGQGKETAVRANLHYAALSALRRLPMDPSNAVLGERVLLGIGCSDPVGVRHSLAMAVELAAGSPVTIANSLTKLAGGSLAAAMRSKDMFARVYLARLCGVLIHSQELYERPDIRGLYSAILFQFLYDPSEKVVMEAILCISGSRNGEGSGDHRADGWQILTTSVVTEANRPALQEDEKDKKGAMPARKEQNERKPTTEPVLKVVVQRLDDALRSTNRPLLHAALRCTMEIGKARAAAQAIGFEGADVIEAEEENEDDALDFAAAMGRVAPPEPTSTTFSVDILLGTLMEGVRAALACECVYVRTQAFKAMIWMQSQREPIDELLASLSGELTDPQWPPPLLNSLLQTLNNRFQVSPGMAVRVLDLASVFVSRVPAKVDTAAIQNLWKMCLVGCGAEGKHLALEAVSAVLDRPRPGPPSRKGTAVSNDGSFVSDPRSAMALQRLVQAAIWFLGENANYAASEYAWESATPPEAALMLLDAERMVAASGIRNPTLAAAIGRLQRCAAVGSWEERVVAAHALVTVAIRSGEPYRLQIYDFFHQLIYGGGVPKDQVRGLMGGWAISNGEDKGASGTGLQSIISPMLRVLDEMYQAQEHMMKEIRMHDFGREEWTDEELASIYESHERLMDLASLFCFIPRAKYLPLGPVSRPFVEYYREEHGIDPSKSANDDAMRESLTALLEHAGLAKPSLPEFPPITLLEPISDNPDAGKENLGALEDDDDAPPAAYSAVNFDDIWASSLTEAGDDDDTDASDGSGSPTPSIPGSAIGNLRNWDEESLSGIVEQESGVQGRDRDRPETPNGAGSASQFEEENEAYGAAAFDEEILRKNTEGKLQPGRAMYNFYAGDDDELDLEVGDEVEIEYEVDGWYHVRKKKPGSDGKVAGLVPALYVEVK
eukprot:TRINITY_DN12688_c0_g1_i1.p1 TRINITY_DN12688_c0_g1~~TRINITY_DN12688_c0_g1_i1.p1  ORF type:complete len:1176 (+),score=259.12 TRINITY_DN12688_c0_g1_i1:411-3938(+)